MAQKGTYIFQWHIRDECKFQQHRRDFLTQRARGHPQNPSPRLRSSQTSRLSSASLALNITFVLFSCKWGGLVRPPNDVVVQEEEQLRLLTRLPPPRLLPASVCAGAYAVQLPILGPRCASLIICFIVRDVSTN